MLPKSLTAAVAIGLCAGLASAAQANTRLLVNCFTPPQHFLCQEILPQWKAAVETATERRVRVNFPAQSMSPLAEQLAAVRSGIFDGAVQFLGLIENEVKGPLVAMMPFTGTSDAEANSVALWRTYEEHLSGVDEFEGVELLSLYVAPGADFYSTVNAPITSLADVTRHKMWALPGAPAEILKGLGGAIVSGPAVQMTETIQRGVVDGFVGIPAIDAQAFNVLPYAKSVTQTKRKIFAPAFAFYISDRKWNEISPEDQAAIHEVSGEVFARLAGGVYTKYEDALLQKLAAERQVIQASDEFEAELEAAAARIAEEWKAKVAAKGLDGDAALTFYTDQVSALSAQ